MKSIRTKRRQFLTVAGSVVLAGCAGEGSESSASSGGQSESSTQPANEDDADGTRTDGDDSDGNSADREDVRVVEMITDDNGVYFDPNGLLVEPETTVRFVTTSGSHTATAYHPDNDDQPLRIPEGADPWDSGTLGEADDPVEVTFTIEGVYDYYCTPHEVMGQVGRIVVGEPRDGPGTTPPDELPPAAREELPAIETILDNETVSGQ
ncbi:plastocyanin/azurin family copper-binding protein [Halosolutus halophilus]|uniref:plastocyanin/azurin family copper-binding protein n=1 Tax=Halosolutus halophilus TaxID=1552990 RepID=UPI0022352DB3|nr:plastocyanin/azurin family copper-binding protein [Halosolutus halophilus]